MIVLALDTCLARCSVAAVAEGAVLAHASEAMERGHAERLAPMVAGVLARAGVSPAMVGRVAVTRGPGSFTGVRIGLAFARGFALATGAPCVGVSTLQALTLGAEARPAAAAIAAAGGAYVAAYGLDGSPVLEPVWATLPEAQAAFAQAGARAVFGPLAPAFGGGEATGVDVVALARFAASAPLADYPPAPLYLRPPDARPPAEAPC